jgi:Uma2 family endonuclease
MATSTLIPVEEYLATSYRPDCDYVDGEVLERNLGEQDHSDLQTRLLEMLASDENNPHIRVNPSIRMQVGEKRYRVPDVCVRRRSAPSEQIFRRPPLLCIEILSPRDTVSTMFVRVRDYLQMGVPEAWMVDPDTRTVIVCSGTTMMKHTTGDLKVPETPVVLSISDIFQALDDY